MTRPPVFPGGMPSFTPPDQPEKPKGRPRVTRDPLSDGQLPLTRDEVAQIFGVPLTTLISWQQGEKPPPFVHVNSVNIAFPARDVGNWIREVQIFKQQYGRFKYLPVGVELIDNREDGDGDQNARSRMNDARLRKEVAQAEKLEMENQIARGELLEKEEVADAWMAILSRVKTRLLNVPYLAARRVTGVESMDDVQSEIKGIIEEALTELTEDWSTELDDEDDD